MSLRDRKKQQTRLAISDVATGLFITRGFEQVTLAEIAEAADVSVKTIFNHFGSKEELFFDRSAELFDGLVAAVRERPAGTTPLGVLHALMRENRVPLIAEGWPPASPERLEQFRGFQAAQEASQALRARRLMFAEELTARFAAAFAEAAGRAERDPAVRAMAAGTGAIVELRAQVLGEHVMARSAPEVTRKAVVAVVDEGFGRLRSAFSDLDVARA